MLKIYTGILVMMVVFMTSSCGTSDLNNDPGTGDRDKFFGTWSVSDQPARLNYQVTIKKSVTSSDQVILQNFADLGNNAVGLVVGNSIVIDTQDLGGGYSTEGSGDYIDKNKLQFEFFLDDGIDKELRKATFTR